MLEYIRGKLTEASPHKVTVEINGLGYALFIPFNNYSKLPKMGEEIRFFISTVIREDSHKRFGFLLKEERDLFEKFKDVSGIGPKTALALIGHMESHELKFAILNGNISVICKIPGIGKKTAERLIIEMRDKIQTQEKIPLTAENSKNDCSSSLIADAIGALVHLGYNAIQAQKAIQESFSKSKNTPTLAELITLALRSI